MDKGKKKKLTPLQPAQTGRVCEIPTGMAFVPAPTAVGQMLVSEADGEGFKWGLLSGPQVPNNQQLLYGTGGPYWANTGGLAAPAEAKPEEAAPPEAPPPEAG